MMRCHPQCTLENVCHACTRHPSEDTFCLPSVPIVSLTPEKARPMHVASSSYTPGTTSEFVAEYDGTGAVLLTLVSKRTVANFDTFEDAQKAAKALNNHEGF